MLESALIESPSRIRTTRRYTAIASIGLQVAFGVFLIGFPLLYPEALPRSSTTPMPLLPPVLTKAPVSHVNQTMSQSATRSHTPTIDIAFNNDHRMLPPISNDPGPSEPTGFSSFPAMTGPVGGLDMSASINPPSVTVVPKPKQVIAHISEGVTRGLLLRPITPVYPAIARATRTSGPVVVTATISKTGTIESLQVVSGPQLLYQAALDAIRAAHYQPYLLNGEPTEVQTTITINFTMGS